MVACGGVPSIENKIRHEGSTLARSTFWYLANYIYRIHILFRS